MVGTRLQRYGTPRDDSSLLNERVLNPNVSSRLDVAEDDVFLIPVPTPDSDKT
jgi:hypothetical protein